MWWVYLLIGVASAMFGIVLSALLRSNENEPNITEQDYIWNILRLKEVPAHDFSALGYYIGWDQSIIQYLAKAQARMNRDVKFSKNWILIESYLDELNYLGEWVGTKEWDDALLEYARLRNEDFWHFNPYWIPAKKSSFHTKTIDIW